jgi:hypothetical protein
VQSEGSSDPRRTSRSCTQSGMETFSERSSKAIAEAKAASDLDLHMERVTGIEPALSAWESGRSPQVRPLTRQIGMPVVTVTDRS